MKTLTSRPLLLADGTPFHLGMTVYLPVGGLDGDGPVRRIETSDTDHGIDSFIHHGVSYNCLTRRGNCGNDISFFYPTREAAFNARIGHLEAGINRQQSKLNALRAERDMGS